MKRTNRDHPAREVLSTDGTNDRLECGHLLPHKDDKSGRPAMRRRRCIKCHQGMPKDE